MTTPSDGSPPGTGLPYDDAPDVPSTDVAAHGGEAYGTTDFGTAELGTADHDTLVHHLDPVETGFADTAPVLLAGEIGAEQAPPAELPPPPPLLSHLQPEYLTPAEAAAAYDDNVVLGSEHDVLPSEPVSRLPRSTPSGAGRVFLPIALCLVGVVALGAGWTHLEAERAAEAQERVAAPADKPPVPALGSASPTPTTSSSAGTSTSPSASASPSASSSAKPSASSSAAPSSSGSASPQPTAVPVADRSVPVVVLNATKRTGLAAAVAKQLRAKGWDVVSVANWRGREVRLTTVFVTGNKEAAATMRRDVPAANGTLPTWSGMSKNRVVLVVADDYPRVG